MTENYAVDSGKRSPVPAVIAGLAGGTGAYFLADKKGFGFKGQKYTSLEDIIREKKDTFETALKKEGISEEEKKAYEAVKKTHEDYFAKVKEFVGDKGKNLKWDEKVKEEGAAVEAKTGELKKEVNNALKKLKNGKIKDFDVSKIEKDKIDIEAKKYLKNHIADDEFKIVKEAKDALVNARKTLTDKATKEGVDAHKIFNKDAYNKIKDDLWKGVEEKAKTIKGPKTWLTAGVAAAALAILGLVLTPKKEV